MRAIVALLAISARLSVLADDYSDDSGGGDDYSGGGDYGGGDDYGGGYGGMSDYGGGYGGGYGDDYGGGGDYDPGPAWSTIDDIAGVEKFVAEDELEPAIVGFFNEDTHGDEIEKFQDVANSHRYDFRFAYSTEDDVREHFKFKGWAVLVYQPTRFTSEKYDRPKARYPARTISAESLGKFIYQKSVPLVGQRTWKSADR